MTHHHREPRDPQENSRPLRILIENSEYWLRNNGDLAMLAVTIARIRDRWPHARIAVLTDSPPLLRAYFPEAEGVSVFDADPWAEPSSLELLAGRLGSRMVGPIALAWLRSRAWLPQRTRSAWRKLMWIFQPGGSADQSSDPTATPTRRPVHSGSAVAAREASLVLALGGGYLTDADPAQTTRVLNLLEYACDKGVPVALVGQGLGPLDNPALQRRAAEVLPKVDFVSLREGRRGREVLRRAEVSPDRILVTGDDAIELAFAARSESMGSDIGICLRVASYSPVSRPVQDLIGQVVRCQTQKRSAALLPLIIAEYRSQDRHSTLPIVRGASDVVPALPRYVHPTEIAHRVSRCRVVVTGAYHLGVFALAQGIPVVALTSSRYYDDKFLGLSEMFGAGLTLVQLNDPSLAQTLWEALEAAWETAPAVRESLRTSARAQIEASRDAFERVFELTEERAARQMTPRR